MVASAVRVILICVWLISAINVPTVQSANNKGNFKGDNEEVTSNSKVTTRDFRSGGIEVDEAVKIKSADKVKRAKTGDYYFLSTGEKKSFLRRENTYYIVYKRRTTPSLSEEELQSRFSSDVDLLRDHGLKKLAKVKIKKDRKNREVLSEMYQADPAISYISPAFTSRDKGGEIAVSPSIVVSIKEDADPGFVLQELLAYNLSLASKLSFTDTEFEMRVNETEPDAEKIFEITRRVAQLPFIKWAEPNFITGIQKQFTPDDPLFNEQWHLHNTGQENGVIDADIDAPEGWAYTRGNGSVIAIIDDGVDLSHEDLSIWSNPGETGAGKETNGVDDDSNGYIDDYQGWDFEGDDNNPGPTYLGDRHGTAVAGVAGATGNNTTGVSGSAQGAVILPIRATESMTCTAFGNAMRYAGKYADVVNGSWSISVCESELNSAISDVVNGNISGAKRGVKGSPVVFASGDDGSGWRKYTITGIPANTYDFKWKFSKDAAISDGYDTVWLDNISWPGGGSEDFEGETVGTIPTGFTGSGDANWTVVNDGVHARGASGKSVKAGAITHSQETQLDITKEVGTGDLTFWVWVSAEPIYDLWEFFIDGTRYYYYYVDFQNFHDNAVAYPASNADTIAVGTSNEGSISGLEERSFYSQFGSALDVVAPSDAGEYDEYSLPVGGITTTDRMGIYGYSSDNYWSYFGGTSSAAAVVAGVVADMIANDPSKTAAEVRTKLRQSADKIGPYAYVGDRNDFYGYGRVNLYSSLECIPSGSPDSNCDGIDDDCDGYVDEEYSVTPTNCGLGVCYAGGFLDCQGGFEVDTCTPGSQNEASDLTCDGLDGDCDGSVDEDYVVDPTSCGLGVCYATGQQECQSGVEVDTCTPGPKDESTDVTCDGLDGDCDGFVDEEYVVTPTNCGLGVCYATGYLECQIGVEVNTCTPGSQHEATDVTCDNLDGDCDGFVDEEYVVTPTSCGHGVCYATGQIECQTGVEVNTCTPGPQNEPTDVTCDGLDGDCDSLVDEDYVVTPTSCGDGVCYATGYSQCQSGVETDTCVPNDPVNWYRDNDGDGYGDATIYFLQCVQPAGPPDYVFDDTDCDDSDANIYPGGPPVRVVGLTTAYYSGLQDAYDFADTGDTIQSKNTTFFEILFIDDPTAKTTYFEAGYDCAFTSIIDWTYLIGDMTVSDGLFVLQDGTLDLQ